MDSILVFAAIAAILTAAISYIHKQKKQGVKCIGCPDSKTCSGTCGSCPGCGTK